MAVESLLLLNLHYMTHPSMVLSQETIFVTKSK